ncbi:MAG: hypothetical protein ACE5E6_03820 [Phycisphaerae bacterium]
MKHGTRYAAKLKQAYARIRRTAGKPKIGEPDGPLHRLAIGILAVHSTDDAAARALDNLLSSMTGWNEVRVSTPGEIALAMGDVIPDGAARAVELARALHAVFANENRLSLDRLGSLPRRDARHYLESLDGVGPFAVASVMLWSLGAHAIPVSDHLLAALRAADLVHEEADRAEVQAFLERHVPASGAREFCAIMNSKAACKRLTALGGRSTETKRSTMKRSAAVKRTSAKASSSGKKASAAAKSSRATKRSTTRRTASSGERAARGRSASGKKVARG